MSACRGCGAEIVWAVTAKGARIPLDAEPVKRAVLEIDDGGGVDAFHLLPALAPVLRAPEEYVVPGRDEPTIRASIVDTFMPHHATCPKADQFKGRRT